MTGGSLSGGGAGSGNPLLEALRTYLLPIGLVTGLLAGFNFPDTGIAASNMGLQAWIITIVFITNGLTLRQEEARRAVRSVGAIAFGLASILLVTPLAALLVMKLPLQPVELAMGLALFCCVPTTLSANISLTVIVGGNAAMALLLTIASNLLGVFTVPFILPLVLGSAVGGVTIAPLSILQQLVRFILLPLLFGQALRNWVPGLAATVDSRRKTILMMQSILLSMVPWMQVSKAVASKVDLNFASLCLTAAYGMAVHLAYLAFNMVVPWLLRLGGPDPVEAHRIRQAIAIAASQKTLPVAMVVLNQLTDVFGAMLGVAAVAIVFSHLAQLVADAVLMEAMYRHPAFKPKPA